MDLQEELPSTHAPPSFWGVWKRWMIWFFAFSISYYILVAIGYSSHGCVTDGAFVSFFGIQGNTVFASIISLLIGLVQRITKWRWFPTTIKGGSMRAIIVGLVFGVFSAFTSHAILVCSAEEIENQAASVKPSVSSCVSLYDQGKYQDARATSLKDQ
jgi:type III secretory pathway component EscS